MNVYCFKERGSVYSKLFVFFFIWNTNGQETGYDSPDNWQFGSDNYSVCAQLKNDSAHTRYADGTPVEEEGYTVTNEHTTGECGYGWIRLDHREIVWVLDASGAVVQRLVWHKGGQGYDVRKPAYGWIDMEDIDEFDGTLDEPYVDNVPHRRGTPQPNTAGMAPIGEPLVPEGTPLENGVPFWDGTSWNSSNFLGKGSPADENMMYNYNVVPTSDSDGIPITWQYKQNRMYSRYNKYADGGSDFGDETAQYAWLMWSFLTTSDGETSVGGGGMMRGLVKNGQEFYRCEVASIKAKAWGYDSETQVGEITAWYIKTRGNSYSPWMYGWIIAEHRVLNQNGSFGPSIVHYTSEITRHEAEVASFSLGTVKTMGTIDYVDLQSNGGILWDITVSRPEIYTLGFNIAIPSSNRTRSMGVYVNGEKRGVVSSASTEYAIQTVQLEMAYGSNTIELRDSEGTSELNVDYLLVAPENYPIGNLQTLDSELAVPDSNGWAKVYPCPVRNNSTLNIEFENKQITNVIVEIYDMTGILVFCKEFVKPDGNVILVDVKLEPALYNLRITNSRTVISKKILVTD